MRKLGNWGMAVALVMGLGAAVALAGDGKRSKTRSRPKPPPAWRTTPVWAKGHNWFGAVPEDKKADPKKADDKKIEAKSAKEPATPAVTAKPAGAGEGVVRSPEEAEFLRRSEACLKLREIALRLNDPELLRRAEQLDEKAWAAYSQQLATKSAGDKFESDEQVLERFLNSTRDEKSPKSSSKIHTVPGVDSNRHASLKEEKR